MPLDLGFLILLAIVGSGVGFRLPGVAPRHAGASLGCLGGLAVPLGLGTLALGVLGLAEVGWLTTPAIAGLLAVGGLVGGREGLAGTARALPRSGGRPGLMFDLPLMVALVGTLLTALAPVTDGDALCYHLQVPKVFLRIARRCSSRTCTRRSIRW